MNTKIFWYSPVISVLHPAVATAAPASPPTRACEELVGKPNSHVMRSHPIAPINAAKTPAFVSTPGLTTLEIVSATAVPNTRNATKFQNAAHTTASCGVRTRVETTVAIELAASWKPLKKSNASATRTMKTIAGVMRTWPRPTRSGWRRPRTDPPPPRPGPGGPSTSGPRSPCSHPSTGPRRRAGRSSRPLALHA